MWAAAIADKGGFSRSAAQFDRYLGALRKAPYFTSDLRNNNEVMQHIVHGAAVLHMNGIDRFSKKFGPYSLNDAVAHHAGRVLENGSGKVKTAGDPHDQARSILRADGHGTHLAWIPVFLSKATAGVHRDTVRALHATLRRVDRDAYWGQAMGVHTGCLFGR